MMMSNFGKKMKKVCGGPLPLCRSFWGRGDASWKHPVRSRCFVGDVRWSVVVYVCMCAYAYVSVNGLLGTWGRFIKNPYAQTHCFWRGNLHWFDIVCFGVYVCMYVCVCMCACMYIRVHEGVWENFVLKFVSVFCHHSMCVCMYVRMRVDHVWYDMVYM